MDARGQARPAHVILAEDDPELRRLLREALEAHGYEVTEVPDGGRFLVCVARELKGPRHETPYDLILSDVRMPVCTGLQIVEALRQAHWYLPVILMTAFADDSTRAGATRAGAVLVDKPFDVDELMAAVTDILSGERGRVGP